MISNRTSAGEAINFVNAIMVYFEKADVKRWRTNEAEESENLYSAIPNFEKNFKNLTEVQAACLQ